MSFIARTHPQQGPNEKVDDRETTPEVFAELDKRFGPFTLDVAASDHNAKCIHFYSIEDDGLACGWQSDTVWCNPPYSNIRPWVEKAWEEWHLRNFYENQLRRIVMLLPANRTEDKAGGKTSSNQPVATGRLSSSSSGAGCDSSLPATTKSNPTLGHHSACAWSFGETRRGPYDADE